MSGEDIDFDTLSVTDWLRLYSISYDEIDDWLWSRRRTALAKRGIREIVPAREAFDAFRAYMNKSPIVRRDHERVLRRATVEGYTYVINQFQSYCREINSNMEAYEVINYAVDFLLYVEKQRRLSYETVNRYVSAIRTFVRHVAEKYKMDVSHLPSYVSVPEPLPKALKPKQVQALLDEASKHYYSHRYEFMLEFLLHSGLRRSEFLNVQLGDLDFEGRTLLVREGKGGTTRIVPMPGHFLDELRFYFRQMGIKHQEHYIFGDQRDPKKPICTQRIHQMFSGLVNRLRIQDPNEYGQGIHLHSLRHTCATYLYISKIPLKEIQHQLGHSSLKSTAIYTQLDVEGLRKMLEPGFAFMTQVIEGAYRG